MKKTIENGQIVLRYLDRTVRYDLALVRKQIEKHEKELETWREYERLLTQRAVDVGYESQSVSKSQSQSVRKAGSRNATPRN